MLILRHAEVRDIMHGREREITDLVRSAYRLHDEAKSELPHSCFLRLPGQPKDRIIALPAYLGGEPGVAGVKWVASFPGNIHAGVDRASAVIVLNSLRTGRPDAFIEASLISAKRTAASAAVAAAALAGGPGTGDRPAGVGLVGCGVINMEVLRFLKAALPTLMEATIFDLSPHRAAEFARSCAVPGIALTVASDRDQVLAAHGLVAIATTAGEPHMNLDSCRQGATVLHISLRDLTVETILAAQNVVDDASHVCRERTSLHLAEQATGGRDFIAASIGEILSRPTAFHRDHDKIAIFSPFGLGILDLALAQFVLAEAVRRDKGVSIEDFLPPPHATPDNQ
jgi:ornithine cyclodeaminase